MRVRETSSIDLSIKNLVSILIALAMGLWFGFGVIERLTNLESRNQLIEKATSFVDKYKCENFERNIVLKRYNFSDIISNAVLGPEFHNTGLWLIGYDGHVKAYSPDEKLLNQIHDLIDNMPLRKLEMSQNKSVCD